MLNIIYKNGNVKDHCNNLRDVQRKFGPQIAKKLSQRLSEAQSFNTVYELMNSGIDNPHLLIGDLEGCIGWDLTAQIRLIMRISDCFYENTIEDIKTMTSIVIEGVRDYHDGNKKWLIN